MTESQLDDFVKKFFGDLTEPPKTNNPYTTSLIMVELGDRIKKLYKTGYDEGFKDCVEFGKLIQKES